MLTDLHNERILITGGSKGLGRSIATALVADGATVTIVARSQTLAGELAGTNVTLVSGDVTNKVFVDTVIGDLQPTILILNAGATPVMAPIDEQGWEDFSAIWNTDVKAGLYGIQAALKTPIPQGSRVLVVSSGAALGGSPLSGGYAGAKRMLGFMVQYANQVAIQRSLGIRFQAILPMQIIGDTNLGQQAAGAYAKRKNITVESYLSAAGKPLSAQTYATHFIKLLTDKSYADGVAYGIKHDGITKLE